MSQFLDSEGLKVLNQDINERRKADLSNIAEEYDSTATYAVGDMVLYDYKLYVCISEIAIAEAWDETHWVQVKIDDRYADKNYFGFKKIPALASTTLTAEQRKDVTGGALADGDSVGGLKNIVFFPAMPVGAQDFGIMTYTTSDRLNISEYNISNANLWSIAAYDHQRKIALSGIISINNKDIPVYPSNTGTFDFQDVNGTLSWTEHKYGPSTTDASATELSYEHATVISLSADRVFTLQTAQANCIPEYDATITNSDSSNSISLTFTGVTIIKTNDSDIGISNNALTLPADTTIEVSIKNGHMIAYNWEA